MTPRSSRPEVRNPVAADPEVAKIIAALSPEAKAALRACLKALSKSWRVKAEASWRARKPPLAMYWAVNAVNARHLSIALAPDRRAVSGHEKLPV